MQTYLNWTNFRVDKCSRFSQIFLKFAKLNPLEIFDNRRFAKISPRENFGNGKFTKMNPREIFLIIFFFSLLFSSLYFSGNKHNTNVYYEIVKMFQVDKKMHTTVSKKYTNLGESLSRYKWWPVLHQHHCHPHRFYVFSEKILCIFSVFLPFKRSSSFLLLLAWYFRHFINKRSHYDLLFGLTI